MKSLVTLLALILAAGFSAATPKSQVACDKAAMNWEVQLCFCVIGRVPN